MGDLIADKRAEALLQCYFLHHLCFWLVSAVSMFAFVAEAVMCWISLTFYRLLLSDDSYSVSLVKNQRGREKEKEKEEK